MFRFRIFIVADSAFRSWNSCHLPFVISLDLSFDDLCVSVVMSSKSGFSPRCNLFWIYLKLWTTAELSKGSQCFFKLKFAYKVVFSKDLCDWCTKNQTIVNARLMMFWVFHYVESRILFVWYRRIISSVRLTSVHFVLRRVLLFCNHQYSKG